jgi:[acyl-carrier-protein] S-malonyltransferase
MAGHSLGEYAALVAAGTLEFDAAVRLVCERARLMQHATPEGTGAMAAILGMDDQELRQVCENSEQGQVVSCANYNSPGQIVIAGDREAVARACEAAKAAGAKRALMLPVSVPSHCDLMRPAARQLQVSLDSARLTPGHIQVLHNVDVQSHESAAGISKALVEQLFMPVRWTEIIETLASLGVVRFAECGPGGVLAGLNRRIVRDAETKGLSDTDTMKKIMQEWS